MTTRQITFYWLITSLLFLIVSFSSDAQAVRYRIVFSIDTLTAIDLEEDASYEDGVDEILPQMGIGQLTAAGQLDNDSVRLHEESAGPFNMRRGRTINEVTTMRVQHTADENLVLLFLLGESDRSEADALSEGLDVGCGLLYLFAGDDRLCRAASTVQLLDALSQDVTIIAYDAIALTPEDMALLADFGAPVPLEREFTAEGIRYEFTVLVSAEEL